MAAEVYKVLGRVKSAGANVLSTLYTVPANAMARIRVTVSNAGSATHNFSIALSKNGAAASNGDYVCDAVNLAKNVEYETAEYTLEAGTVVRVKTDDGTDFTFQAHGVEYYTPAQAAYFDVIDGGVQSTVKLYNLEDNLTYVFYTDEDSLARVGFRGYGPDNELAVNFPSPYERSNFLTALDNARFYGYGIYGPSSTPIVYLGDNTIAGASTTTTSTSTTTTTSTSTTTTTTAAPGTTTSTTSTTTTAGPPAILVDFGRTNLLSSCTFSFALYDTIESESSPSGVIDGDVLYSTDDHPEFLLEGTYTMWTQNSISDETVVKGFGRTVPISTLSATGLYTVNASITGNWQYYQFRMWDVTDLANPVIVAANPALPPEGANPIDYPPYRRTGQLQGATENFNMFPILYPGRSYRFEVRTYPGM